MLLIESNKLGGTCVNAGCVPKKVMWNATSFHEMLHDAKGYGLNVTLNAFDWKAMKNARDAYVARLNRIYAGTEEEEEEEVVFVNVHSI